MFIEKLNHLRKRSPTNQKRSNFVHYFVANNRVRCDVPGRCDIFSNLLDIYNYVVYFLFRKNNLTS